MHVQDRTKIQWQGQAKNIHRRGLSTKKNEQCPEEVYT